MRSYQYSRSPYGSAGVSPPHGSYRPDSHYYPSSLPSDSRYVGDRGNQVPSLSTSTSDPSALTADGRPAPAILIRRLPRGSSTEALGSMLIFAGDLIDTEFVPSPYPEDQNYATAVARFRSQGGALDAQQKLHMKPNTTKEANMIVEMHTGNLSGSVFDRRNTIDGVASRTQSSSSSSGGSLGGPPGRSRYGSTFQSNDKISPPLPTSTSAEFPIRDTNSHFHSLFSPSSPLTNGLHDRHRVSGKSIINDDSVDDETGDLLKDPVAYAKNPAAAARRATQPQLSVSRFSGLSLSTADGSGLAAPAVGGVTSPRNINPLQSPGSAISPTSNGVGQNGSYGANYPRPQYPPVNPADQNPPCNTLYVGNLPIDTSEDELKAIFSKQRGYKRLCFRTKQNGPMCFVEFEDVSFATKALNELYGYPLHNSVKGGIRLSFSKNPLGVRSNQINAPNGVMNPQAMAPGYSGVMSGGNFSAVSGPPPGLAMPPGLSNGSTSYRPPPPQPQPQPQPSTGMDAMFTNPFGLPSPEFTAQLHNPRHAVSGGVPAPLGSGTFGRDSRPGYSAEYSLGR